MSQKTRSLLRVHVEETLHAPRPELDDLPAAQRLCQAFAAVTGCSLRYRRGSEPVAEASWSRRIADGAEGEPAWLTMEPSAEVAEEATAESAAEGDQEPAMGLAEALADVFEEVQKTRRALWQREAELAAGVPISLQADEPAHLAARLELVLRAGALAIDCQSAAVYLLDDATKRLKLRSAWGLPKTRFLDPPRPLRGAAADLEALVGHAVVLEDTRFLSHWKIPEEFRSAVCVPVSTSTTPLGTLWAFCDRPRRFSEHETNLAEIVAGRVASDLEREMLLHQLQQTRTLVRQLDHAAQWQQSRLPRLKPLLDGWQVAAWNIQGDVVGGDFYDWYVLPDGSLAIAVGDAQGKMIEAGLTAATVHTALRSHAGYRHTTRSMIERINETLWTASVGDQFASMFYALIQPATGATEYTAAGPVYAAVIGEAIRTCPAPDEPPLGTQPDGEYRSTSDRLGSGEVLAVLSEGVYRALRPSRCRVLWRLLQNHRGSSAEELVERARIFLQRSSDDPRADDQTILVVKRDEGWLAAGTRRGPA